jgi:hypothetical protein
MNKLSKALASAAVASLAMLATHASAAIICAGCAYVGGFNDSIGTGTGTYLGAHNATTFDISPGFFGEFNTIAAATSFNHTWLFDFAPAGSASVNANFLSPPDTISGFLVELFTVNSATCGATGSACTAVSLGASQATGVNVGNSSNIGFTALAAGSYAFVVSGTALNRDAQYSGQLATAPQRIPEPATLALVGMALLGAAAARRKST